jgi:hypothetical protein
MAREKLTQDELRNLILFEAEKADLEAAPQNIQFLGVEYPAPDKPNWTIGFEGPLMYSADAARLLAIVQRLGKQYDIEWRALH